VMWRLERLYPDYKSIAEFQCMHRAALTAAGAELVRFAKSCGLIRGAGTEISLAVIAYNLKRIANVLGTVHVAQGLLSNDKKLRWLQESSSVAPCSAASPNWERCLKIGHPSEISPANRTVKTREN